LGNEKLYDGSVARRWKKVMETGIRFANISEKDRESLSRLSFSKFELATK